MAKKEAATPAQSPGCSIGGAEGACTDGKGAATEPTTAAAVSILPLLPPDAASRPLPDPCWPCTQRSEFPHPIPTAPAHPPMHACCSRHGTAKRLAASCAAHLATTAARRAGPAQRAASRASWASPAPVPSLQPPQRPPGPAAPTGGRAGRPRHWARPRRPHRCRRGPRRRPQRHCRSLKRRSASEAATGGRRRPAAAWWAAPPMRLPSKSFLPCKPSRAYTVSATVSTACTEGKQPEKSSHSCTRYPFLSAHISHRLIVYDSS